MYYLRLKYNPKYNLKVRVHVDMYIVLMYSNIDWNTILSIIVDWNTVLGIGLKDVK